MVVPFPTSSALLRVGRFRRNRNASRWFQRTRVETGGGVTLVCHRAESDGTTKGIMQRRGVLIAEADAGLRDVLAQKLRADGYEVGVAEDGNAAVEALRRGRYSVLVSNPSLPGYGAAVTHAARQVAPNTLVVILAGPGADETALRALREGGPDYVLMPVNAGDIATRLRDLLEYGRRQSEAGLEPANPVSFLVGRSPAMQRIVSLITQVAPTGATVLITGESGTGKEVVARAIHHLSHLRDSVFLPVNCGAIPEQLLEGQLFGHMKGAFTGADSTQQGFFHRAEGGTILLDEIAELPLHLQVKLLRVIEEKEMIPIGATTPIPVKVRVIASTNRDLRRAVADGRFREDLYYRLNVVRVDVPPLRDRREDILPLADFMIERYNRDLGRAYRGVANDALEVLMALSWKGNVRELGHAIEYAMIVGDGEWIRARDLPADLVSGSEPIPESNETLAEATRRFEKAYLENLLRHEAGNRRALATRLGIDPSTLYRKLQAFGIK
jgi:DNA-binding NtrC family response regulator